VLAGPAGPLSMELRFGGGGGGGGGGVPGSATGPASAVAFLAATGSSVVVLKGLVPCAGGFRDLDSSVEVALVVRLADTAPHHNLVRALHFFVGSAALVRPWVAPAQLPTLPDRVPYLVTPYYPLSLRALCVARRASGRPCVTELEVLLVCMQTLSGLLHLLAHGYIHRNVTVSGCSRSRTVPPCSPCALHAPTCPPPVPLRARRMCALASLFPPPSPTHTHPHTHLLYTHAQVNTILFDCRRFQAPDAVSALEAAVAASGPSPLPCDPKLSEWSGVEAGVHCPVVLAEPQHARRIVQAAGTDYIFGEHTQLLGGGSEPGATAPEVRGVCVGGGGGGTVQPPW
jgi:hypothetical protein